MKPLSEQEKKNILIELEKQYGIKELPFMLIKFGEEKIRIFSGDLKDKELLILDKELRIENAGLYFAKQEHDGIRLTFDALSIVKDQITKNILELNEDEHKDWLKGNELYIKSDKAYKVLKYKEEFVGCGKSTSEKIANFMPKERRIR